MRILSIVLGCAISFLVAFPSMALPLGACADAATTNRALSAEGQRIVATSANNEILLTSGASSTGYVLQADKSGSLCVASLVASVGAVRTFAASDVSQLCDNPARFPGATTTCQSLQKEWPRIVKTISARSTKSSLSSKMTGPVNVEFVICADKAKREVICGRVETLVDRVGNR